MRVSLEGKRAVVCGSTQGIGRACAHELAAAGAQVTLVARNVERLTEVQASLPRPSDQSHEILVADFSDPSGLDASVRAHASAAPRHILINNTGGPPGGRAIDASPEEYLDAYSKHLICNQILARALVPGMTSEGYGRIINIISTSVREPIPNLGVSNTTRGAVASWAKTLSRELGPHGITVNNVLPGFTETQRLDSLMAARAQREGIEKETLLAQLAESVPARRFAMPEETAYAICFLASPLAAYISGVSLPVDGGRLNGI
ncbi:MAG: SDR family oxidoreductase [Planctomycetes bacterium]|nr:SDR family oxidoreductase [Planctomycetota bacterium]